MKVLFDTNVLIAALVQGHEFHQRAYPWMVKAKKAEIGFYISQHSLAEMYSILTTLPVRPRISPEIAKQMIRENMKPSRVVSLAPNDYRWCINQMAFHNLPGGAIYDSLIARAALKSAADRLLTFDPEDFRRVLPEKYHEIILVPS